MAYRIYKGDTPLIQQPKVGNLNFGRAYVGNNLVYGAVSAALPSIYTTNLDQWFAPEAATTLSEYVTDQSGNARNGSISNPDSFLSYESTGVGLNYTAQPLSPENVIDTDYLPNYKSAFTVQIWVKFDILNQESVPAFVNNRTTSAVDNRLAWTINGTQHSFIIYSGTSSTFNLTYTQALSTWKMMTFTTNGENSHKLYADTTSVSSGSTTMTGTTDGDPLRIAGQFKGNTNRWIKDASIGSYKIYSEELSLANITTNYNAEKATYGL